MNTQLAREATEQFFVTLGYVLPWMAGMGLIFTILSFFMPCNPGKPWWKKDGLLTDLGYWIFIPVFTRYLRIWITVVGTILIFGISDGKAELTGYGDWTEYLHVIDEKLAAALDLFAAQVTAEGLAIAAEKVRA